MSILIQDEATAMTLAQADGPQEVRGPDGRVLGRFIPAARPGVTFPEVGLTDEELDRRADDPAAKWHTPDEVTARLRAVP